MSGNSEVKNQDMGACEPGCGCGKSGASARGRMVVGMVILVVASMLVVRAMVKDNAATTANAVPAGFAALPAAAAAVPTPAAKPVPVADTMKEVESLWDLNSVAGDTFGVFVFLPGRGETAASAPMAQLQSAVRIIESQLRGGKIGLCALKEGSRDYEQLARQMAVPGVVAMVKGGGMSATWGDITETKLVQALVAASGLRGCGAGGCGPRGCN